MTKLKALVLTFTMTVAMAATVGCRAKTEFDPHQYSKLTLIGPNGYAMATVDKDVKFTGANSKLTLEEKENIIYMMAKTEYEITPAENLKNGDIVKIKPVIDEQLAKEKKVKPIIREKEVVVDGLKEPKAIVNLFDNIDLSYGSIDGQASAICFHFAGDKYLDDINNFRYDVQPNKNLSNGDQVVVTAVYDKIKLLEKGYVILGEKTKNYVIEGLPSQEEYNKINKKDYSFTK